MAISLGLVNFSAVGETQLDWSDQYAWQPIGQTIRYGLAGNPVILENTRSGRPITLVAELPWAWLTAAGVKQCAPVCTVPRAPWWSGDMSPMLGSRYPARHCYILFTRCHHGWRTGPNDVLLEDLST